MNKKQVIKDIDGTIALYQEALDTGDNSKLQMSLYCRFCITHVYCIVCPNRPINSTYLSPCANWMSIINLVPIKAERIKHRMSVLKNWKKKILSTKGRITLDQYRQLQESVDCKIKKKRK